MSSNPSNMYYGDETTKRQTRAACGCLGCGSVHGGGLGLCGLQAVRPLCLCHKSAAAAAVCGLWRKVSAIGQPTRPTQPSIPSGPVNE